MRALSGCQARGPQVGQARWMPQSVTASRGGRRRWSGGPKSCRLLCYGVGQSSVVDVLLMLWFLPAVSSSMAADSMPWLLHMSLHARDRRAIPASGAGVAGSIVGALCAVGGVDGEVGCHVAVARISKPQSWLTFATPKGPSFVKMRESDQWASQRAMVGSGRESDCRSDAPCFHTAACPLEERSTPNGCQLRRGDGGGGRAAVLPRWHQVVDQVMRRLIGWGRP